jgi:hypothetical protein
MNSSCYVGWCVRWPLGALVLGKFAFAAGCSLSFVLKRVKNILTLWSVLDVFEEVLALSVQLFL